MRDSTLGFSLFGLGIVAMIAYFWAIFVADIMYPELEFLGRSIGDWAILIPVLVVVYLFLFIVVWMGLTMATTPPPLPLEKKESTIESPDFEDQPKKE